MAFDKDISDKLLDAANDGAKSLKALFFWYVGALTYAVISVAGVSDEQLLRESPLKLPIIGVDIPLVEYFAFLPLVVVIVHLELLVQFALLSNKINDFHASLRRAPPEAAADFRLRLENFMLSHLLAGDHRAILRCLLFFLMYASLVLMPLFSLLLIQVQFLAYHSAPMMLWHRVLILIDVLALLYFWPNLFHRQDMTARAWLHLMVFRVLPHAAALLLVLAAIYWLLARFNLMLTLILAVLGGVLALCLLASVAGQTLLRAKSDAGAAHRKGRRLHRILEGCGHHCVRIGVLALLGAGIAWIFLGIHVLLPADSGPDLEIALLTLAALIGGGALILATRSDRRRGPLRFWYRQLTYWAGRIHTQSLRHDAPGMTVFGVQCLVALLLSALLLTIPASGEPMADLANLCETVRRHGGFGPAARDAAVDPDGPGLDDPPAWYALLAPTLPAPVLESVVTQVKTSVLPIDPVYLNMACTEAWSEATPGDSAGQGSPAAALILRALGKRRVLAMNEGVLVNQAVSGAEILELHRDGSEAWRTISPIDLRGRNLVGIQLKNAVLPRALLDDAILDRADLSSAKLQGASLRRATLNGAWMSETCLDEAVLDEAGLPGALLDRASLRGASLQRAQLQGAMLDSADLTKANLNHAQLQGSQMYRTELPQAAMIGVGLQGAMLWGANLQRAILWDADVRGADLSGSLLEHAILSTRAGRLGDKDDLALMPATTAFGEWYEIVRMGYQSDVETGRETAWPPDAGALPCMLISVESLLPQGMNMSEVAPSGPSPGCAFSFESDDAAHVMFWRGFLRLEERGLCDGIGAGAGDPLQSMPLLRYALDGISYSASEVVGDSMGRRIAVAIMAELTGPVCSPLWSKQSLQDALARLEKNADDESVSATMAFHRAWILGLKDPAANPPKGGANNAPAAQK